jgi:anti-anti-sigma factor
MEPDLIITTEQVQGRKDVMILHLQGWLDSKNEEHFLRTGRVAYEAGARFLVIDLGKIENLTSAGLRAIQKVYKIFTPADEHLKKVAHIRICNAPPHIYKILEIMGLLQNIPSYTSVQAAIASFGG